jgi:basic amino acid/polyamine antiporter, APA family
MQSAANSAAPIGDMMVLVGDALFGPGHGRTFMLFEAFTVILALIGTTLSCMNTGARVTYAMGKDRELGGDFGRLHQRNLTPHRAIWTLAIISAVIGCVAVSILFGDGGAPTDAAIAAIPHGLWSSLGYTTHDRMAALPNTLLTVTLASNFGTFVLYALSCALCIVAYHKHERFSVLRHLLIPVFGLLANLACMAFYLIGPYGGFGTPHEPLLALAIAAVWAIYGAIHFLQVGRTHNKPTLTASRTPTS